MKKLFYSISIIFLIILGACLIIVVLLPYSKTSTYSSVKVFEFKEEKVFFDFYAPASYFDSQEPKQTLRDINMVKIWYRGEEGKIGDYNINFKGSEIKDVPDFKDVEITYWVQNSSEGDKEDLKSRSELIEDYIYQEGDGAVFCYVTENHPVIIVMINAYNQHEYNETEINTIGIQILKDSLALNQK